MLRLHARPKDGRVEEVVRSENLRASPYGYELDSKGLLNRGERARRRRRTRSASTTRTRKSAAEPSQTDINLAALPALDLPDRVARRRARSARVADRRRPCRGRAHRARLGARAAGPSTRSRSGSARSCGFPLVYAGYENIDPEYTRGDLVRVAGGRNQAEAELIQNLLLEEGIPSIVRRTAGFDVPDYLAGGPRDVLVAESAVAAGPADAARGGPRATGAAGRRWRARPSRDGGRSSWASWPGRCCSSSCFGLCSRAGNVSARVRGRELTRRDVIERGGALGLAAFVAQVPGVLAAKGWLEEAYAQSGDVVVDTLSGLVAFILPGDDPYSEAQGTKTRRARRHRARAPCPSSSAISTRSSRSRPRRRHGDAARIRRRRDAAQPLRAPGQPGGGRAATACRRSRGCRSTRRRRRCSCFEADPLWDDTEFKFVGGILPGFIGFLAWSEAGVIDPETREPDEQAGRLEAREVRRPRRGARRVPRLLPRAQVRQRGRRGARRRRRLMRDVIVIGAGGGGPVVAKELARAGSTCSCSRRAPATRTPRRSGATSRTTPTTRSTATSASGRPTARSRRGCASCRRTRSCGRSRRGRDDAALLRQLPARGARRLRGLQRAATAPPTTARTSSRSPTASSCPTTSGSSTRCPCRPRRWARRRRCSCAAPQRMGLPLQRRKDITRDVVPPAGERDPPARRHRRAGPATRPSCATRRPRGCTFCGFCFQGCYEPRGAPRNLAAKRSTDNSLRPDGADRRRVARGRQGGHARHRRVRHADRTDEQGGARSPRRDLARHATPARRRPRRRRSSSWPAGCTENPRLWLNSGLPNPNDWVGRGYTDHYFDWVIGVMPRLHRLEQGRRARRRALRLPRPRRARERRAAARAAGVLRDVQRRRHRRPLRQRRAARDGRAPTTLGRLRRHRAAATLLEQHRPAAQRARHHRRRRRGAEPGDAVDDHARRRARARSRRSSSTSARARARTRRNREFLAAKAVELLRAAGAQQVHRIDWPPLILHVQSTMRMGARRVELGARRRTPRRAASSASSWPTTPRCRTRLGGPNPTLTTQALATRTAEKIFTRYFDGDPWVEDGDPGVVDRPQGHQSRKRSGAVIDSRRPWTSRPPTASPRCSSA